MIEIIVAGLRRNLGSLPILVAVPTLLFYFMAGPPGAATPAESWATIVLAGGLVGVVIWLLLGYFHGYRSVPASVNRRSFDELQDRIASLAQSLEALEPDKDTPGHQTLAWKQASRSLTTLQKTLRDAAPSEGWASGESYVSAWTELHRAEAQLSFLIDREQAIAGAKLDLLRLNGSRIRAQGDLEKTLRCAIESLGGTCEDLSDTCEDADETAAKAGAEADATKANAKKPEPPKDDTAANGSKGEENDEPALTIDAERDARETIAMVHRQINEYIDTRYDGLVRLAMSLRRWRLLLGLVVYALFVVAILSVDRSVVPGLVESFAVYFLIGAGVGAANELRKRSATRPEVDDYGVSQARYLLVPSLAGAAACGGAFIFGVLTGSSLGDLLAVDNGDVDWTRLVVAVNPALAIVAAIFGLAPSRIFKLLDSLGDSLTNEISTSEATEMEPDAGATNKKEG